MAITSDAGIQPFDIEIPYRDLENLHKWLDRTRWPKELPDAGWEYRVSLEYL